VAANIGGIGTPVGTPPNAIALGALAKHGVAIGFTQWMVMAVPFMLVTLAVAWVVFLMLFRSPQQSIRLTMGGRFDTSRPAKIYYVTAALTLLLWFTEELHGISANIVGFVPVVVLLATGVFTGKDLQAVEWPVLWLVAGGIALGTGVGTSGLDRWMVGLVSWESLSPAVLAGAMSLAALLMGTFMSHSATTNLLVPLGIGLATSGVVAISPAIAAVFIAIGASLAMALPISTPPNAIAMSTGAVRTKDMAVVGVIIGTFGWFMFAVAGAWWWRLAGVMPQ
jgi:sodium-dependent dicarboxylate transporter 2/3/5